jgi:very-short-patch-repair endonuclease
LDFVVVGLSGTRYNIEIDGRQHYFSAEAIAEDNVRDKILQRTGYKVIRLRAIEVTKNPDHLRELLGSLA